MTGLLPTEAKMDRNPALSNLMMEIDRQIAAEKNKRPPGDRRRNQGQPPEGSAERRKGTERRANSRKN